MITLPKYRSAWRFALPLLLIVAAAGALRFASYRFSLPYVDHPDEPAYYLGGQEWRGLYDSGGYYAGIPPAYVWLHTVAQPALEALGIVGLAATVEFFRLIAVLVNLLTLVIIALTARQAAGDLAGWVAGAAWGSAPLVLINGVYALPDPFIYAFTALAYFFALAGWAHPARRAWLLGSVISGLLATLMKYPALPALLPGVTAALLVGLQRQQGGIWQRWRWLIIALLLIAGVGLWLLLGYGVDLNNLQREGATVQREGLRNLFDLSRVINNLYYTIYPINALAFALAGALAVLVGWRARRMPGARLVDGRAALLGALLLIAVPWLVSSFIAVEATKIRHVLPGTTAACVLFGMAVGQIAELRSLFARAGVLVGALIVLLAAVWIPQMRESWAVAEQRRQPDRRVELRQWFDINLDPGTVIVSAENHKTFNPIWGGIPHRRWVDWWISDNLMQYPLDEWVTARGMSYVALTDAERQRMEATDAGRAYLAQMLPLRDFSTPGENGPAMRFYRLWRMQAETAWRFGDSITLVGYDQSAETLRPGENLTLRFYWNAPQTPPDNYSLFIHLTAPDESVPLAQADGAPGVPERPTLSWDDPSETLISPPFTLSIPADLAAGSYAVRVGVYNYLNGQRLPIRDEQGALAGDALLLTAVSVRP